MAPNVRGGAVNPAQSFTNHYGKGLSMFEWIKTESGFERVERYGFNGETIIPTGDFLTYGYDARDVWRLHTVVDGVEYVAPIDGSRGSVTEQADHHLRLLRRGWRPELLEDIFERTHEQYRYGVSVEPAGENNGCPLDAAMFLTVQGARAYYEARAAEIRANIYWADGATAYMWQYSAIGNECMDMYRAEA